MTAPPAAVPAWLQALAAATATLRADELSPFRPPPDADPRAAAVLVLFGDGPAGPDVLLIERAATMRSHAGQPAFPGGAVDAGDSSPAATALREAAEEVGVRRSGVRVLATLPQLWLAPSGFAVTPVLAWWHTPCAVVPVDRGEVAAVSRVPVRELADPAARLSIRHPSGYVGPAFDVRGMLVWGFTAGLLDRLLALGGWEQPWDPARVRLLSPATIAMARRTAHG